MTNALTIAQARLPEPSAATFVAVLASILILVLIATAVLNLWRMLAPKKPGEVVLSQDPMRTQKVPELATKDELVAMSERIETDIEEVKVVAASRDATREGQVIAIHNRINTVAEGLEAIRGQLVEIAQNQRLLMNKFLK